MLFQAIIDDVIDSCLQRGRDTKRVFKSHILKLHFTSVCNSESDVGQSRQRSSKPACKTEVRCCRYRQVHRADHDNSLKRQRCLLCLAYNLSRLESQLDHTVEGNKVHLTTIQSVESYTSVITAFRLFGPDPIHAFKVAHSHGKAGFMRSLDGVLFLLKDA